jgi:hypothetical protein
MKQFVAVLHYERTVNGKKVKVRAHVRRLKK